MLQPLYQINKNLLWRLFTGELAEIPVWRTLARFDALSEPHV
jgi:hypothetical protein